MGSPGEGAQDRESEGGGEAKYEAKYESPRTMVKPIVGVTLEAEPQGPRKNVFILPKYYLFLLVLSFTENMCISNKVTLNDSHNCMKEVVMCISNKSSIG